MCLMRFNAKAEYAPGKTLVIADTLSRSPVQDSDNTTDSVIACHVNYCHTLLASITAEAGLEEGSYTER